MREYQRAHPVTIFFNLGRVFYLIIIPVLRGFIAALRGGFANWLSGAWMDILVFLAMIGVASLAWFFVAFRCDEKRIEIKTGLLNRRYVSIPWENVTTLALVESFYLRPIRALRLRADTLGGSFKDADFTILLSNNQVPSVIQNRPYAGEAPDEIYRPTTGSVVALSLLTSNSFGGIIFISTFISQSGKLLGKEFSETIIGIFEEATRRFAFGIPYAAAAIAYILLAGWFIGFLLSFVKYKNFTLSRSVNTLGISGSIFTRREYYIRYPDINFIDIRQSMAAKLFKLQSLYISAVGYGKQKNDISCIIPAEKSDHFDSSRRKIFPAMQPIDRQLAPEAKGIMRFLGQPLFLLCGVILATVIFLWIFPSWSGFILFVGLMTLIPAALFMLIRIVDFKTGGVSRTDNGYVLRYSSGLTLHTVVIPADKIVRVELRKGFFQKFGPYCDLIISSRAEARSLHCCRSLEMSGLKKLFNI